MLGSDESAGCRNAAGDKQREGGKWDGGAGGGGG